ncbi:MAG: AAA family ATPase [Dehalococcoidia bacterium]
MIRYLVGENGTGKTRRLRQIAEQEDALFVPKLRQQPNLAAQWDDEQAFQRVLDNFQNSPEQTALRILRESSALRLKVFSILSRKLERDLSMTVVERSTSFTVRAGITPGRPRRVEVPTYGLTDESAGIRELLVLLTLLHCPRYQKLCIDEPELSLHPEAQRFLKNEMGTVVENQGKEIWLATHSPVFFAPESLEDLKQAMFFASPAEEPTWAALEKLGKHEETQISRALLRLDSEKWLLAHAKSAIFCEGHYDKAIIRRVLKRLDLDLARRDMALIEVGGHGDFYAMSLLCLAIERAGYYVADLDALLDCSLIDHLGPSRTPAEVKEELKGTCASVKEYVQKFVRQRVGSLVVKLKQSPPDTKGLPHLSSYVEGIASHHGTSSRDTAKKLCLEAVARHSAELIPLVSPDMQNELSILRDSIQVASDLLEKCGILILSSGAIEAHYDGWQGPTVGLADTRKRNAFEAEYTLLEVDDVTRVSDRYRELIEFFRNLVPESFDYQRFVRAEIERILSRLQTILLEEKPEDIDVLKSSKNYLDLKVGDLILPEGLHFQEDHWILRGKSADSFELPFIFSLDTSLGIQNPNTIRFT